MSTNLQHVDKPLGFLLHDVARLLRRRFDQHAQGEGLTRAQWHVLAVLKRNEGVNQAGLADLMDMEPISLSRHIDRLQANGWVDRRPDAEDRRAHRLYLGARVQPLLDQMHEVAHEVFGMAFAGFSEAEADQLIDLLTRMRANLAARAETVSPSPPAPRKAAGKPVKETAQ
jgi:DNA-binding MarR family transcriptional regulator